MKSDPSRVTRRTFVTTGAAALLTACAPASTFAGAAATGFDPAFATASETVDAIRRKKISARELVEATFQRIDRYNPKINAIIVEFRARARSRAKEADEALAKGKTWGPLHGIPVTVKEAFAYEGSPNTWGRPEFKGNSLHTATAVGRMESAGAIVLGKTNIPTGLADIQCSNEIYGTTNNPSVAHAERIHGRRSCRCRRGSRSAHAGQRLGRLDSNARSRLWRLRPQAHSQSRESGWPPTWTLGRQTVRHHECSRVTVR